MNASGESVLFMEMVYKMLLTQGDERINMVVNKLKETEQDILQTAATYIQVIKVDFDGTGTEKIKDHLTTITTMANQATIDLEKNLAAIMKKVTTTAELFNIRLISEYIYMEIILVYLIFYFKK